MQDIINVQRWSSEVHSDREWWWDEDRFRERDWMRKNDRDEVRGKHDQSQCIEN